MVRETLTKAGPPPTRWIEMGRKGREVNVDKQLFMKLIFYRTCAIY